MSIIKHKCVICKNIDHEVQDCPDKCIICFSCHKTENHKCYICNKFTKHIENNCPFRCRYCNGYHKSKDHYCYVCGSNAEHFSYNCPKKYILKGL